MQGICRCFWFFCCAILMEKVKEKKFSGWLFQLQWNFHSLSVQFPCLKYVKCISMSVWLPSDNYHFFSIHFSIAFCRFSGNANPFQTILSPTQSSGVFHVTTSMYITTIAQKIENTTKKNHLPVLESLGARHKIPILNIIRSGCLRAREIYRVRCTVKRK